jgi:hypothetical protein
MFLRDESLLSSGFFKQSLIMEVGMRAKVSIRHVYGGAEKERDAVRPHAPDEKRKRKTPQKIIRPALTREKYKLQRSKKIP